MDEPAEARAALDLIREIGGDELVVALLKTFISFAGEQLVGAATAAAAGDAAGIARVAHTLKASSRQLGAVAMAEVCEAAERAGLAADVPGAVAGVAAMQREFDLACQWMQAMRTE
jgi:HPt (histidine-containing phosphotransfer) domain-containing protein